MKNQFPIYECGDDCGKIVSRFNPPSQQKLANKNLVDKLNVKQFMKSIDFEGEISYLFFLGDDEEKGKEKFNLSILY